MSDLLSVSEALRRILDGAQLMPPEEIALAEASDRVLAEAVAAKRTQPPFAASAMDGYAVRADDLAAAPNTLTMIGESAAGHGFKGKIEQGQCVRIFTGAPLPVGADSVAIQENATADGDQITFSRAVSRGRYVRPAGMDFHEGDALLKEGRVLDPGALSLAAAMNHPNLRVRRKPKVAIIASGDELVQPGQSPSPDQIVASNTFGVAAIVAKAGGQALDMGIAADTTASLSDTFDQASCADIIVTLGGASVGDHDLVRETLEARGASLSFWKLAMRPGKPVMFGTDVNEGTVKRYIGLPGNPVSSLVCAQVFLVPLIRAHLGLSTQMEPSEARLAIDLPANDQREEYMRATIEWRDGEAFVTPFDSQDSSLLTLYAKADCLMIRPAFQPAQAAGATCQILLL
ncbi:MAG: molybdopterin molybdotransferase MoeA [Ahrensia sp.]|nr:molybdopterin molybdotransferase MoeA [Ahrensia sp.]